MQPEQKLDEEQWPDAISDYPLRMHLDTLTSDQIIELLEWQMTKQDETNARLGDMVADLKADNRELRLRWLRWRDAAIVCFVIIVFMAGWVWWLVQMVRKG